MMNAASQREAIILDLLRRLEEGATLTPVQNLDNALNSFPSNTSPQ